MNWTYFARESGRRIDALTNNEYGIAKRTQSALADSLYKNGALDIARKTKKRR
jgi:hypothetical protein